LAGCHERKGFRVVRIDPELFSARGCQRYHLIREMNGPLRLLFVAEAEQSLFDDVL